MLSNYFIFVFFMEYIEIVSNFMSIQKSTSYFVGIHTVFYSRIVPFIWDQHIIILYNTAVNMLIQFVTVNRSLEGVWVCVILFPFTELYYQRSTLAYILVSKLLESYFFSFKPHQHYTFINWKTKSDTTVFPTSWS